jgi:glycerate kinase
MKIIIAPDSFKGSLTAQVAAVAEKATGRSVRNLPGSGAAGG